MCVYMRMNTLSLNVEDLNITHTYIYLIIFLKINSKKYNICVISHLYKRNICCTT